MSRSVLFSFFLLMLHPSGSSENCLFSKTAISGIDTSAHIFHIYPHTIITLNHGSVEDFVFSSSPSALVIKPAAPFWYRPISHSLILELLS